MTDEEKPDSEKSEETERLLQELARDRPKFAELVRALLAKTYGSLQRCKNTSPVAIAEEFQSLADDFFQAATWIVPDAESLQLRREEIAVRAKQLFRQGLLTLEDVIALTQSDDPLRFGRPISRRYVALQALDEKLKREQTGEQLSWAQLATKFRYCDESTPAVACGGRLSKQAKELDRLIARLSSGEKS